MGKIKIHEIAKELGLTSKEIIEKATSLGIKASSHLSSIEDDDANKIRESFGTKSSKKEEKATKSDKKEDKKKEDKKGATPVIIRREVIVTEDTKKTTEKPKTNQSDIGFVERKKNQDYNIVYREKKSKPMTFSELFGIKDKKAEEKKAETEKKAAETIKVEAKKEEKDVKVEKVTDKKAIEEKTANKKEENVEKTESKVSIVEEKKSTTEIKEKNVEKANTIQKEKEDKAEKSMEQTARKEYNNNNGYKRNEGYTPRDNRGYDNRNNQEGRENRNNYNNRFGNNNYERNNNFDRNNKFQKGGYNKNENGYGNNNYGNNRNGFNNRNNNDNRNGYSRNGSRPLDEKGIDKNIKDIMSVEIVEKESQRDYNSRSIDKEKQNKFEENKASNTKKQTKSKKNGRFEEFDGGKLKGLKQVDKLSHMFDEQDGGMLDYYDLSSGRNKGNRKKNNKTEMQKESKQKIFELKEVTIPEKITVKDFAAELKKTSSEVIKKLFGLGIMATINNEIDFDTAFLVASEFGITANKKEVVNEEDILFDESEDSEEELEARPPVVVVMGHVDHGKTSLLDTIRRTNVIEGEAGGITQHIGAYKVNINDREITFLDTPGHEAFTSMRARGAQITDIAILVVAANDGVMPQTVEAINHAKAAEIPIIVAVNKIDLPDANVEKVKQELMQYELVSEEWGGDTIFVPISAKNNTNIDTLLEMVLLVADMQELKANPHKQSKGVVIEAKLDKSKGPIASVLVQRGTLDVGDTVVVGTSIGRIRAMKNDKGQNVKEAGPSTPVEIMGLTEVPEAGDTFYEVKNEKMAKHLIEKRRAKEREKMMNTSVVTLNNLFEKMANDELKQLNLIVKADVQGSAEAVKQSLEKLSNDEVKVKVIHSVPGGINESDVQLAKAAGAIIIGFNVRPIGTAKEVADREGVEIKLYSIIYQAIEDVEAAMKGMLDPVFEEKIIGNAEVRQTFKVSNVGTIAGCFVIDGKVERNAGVRVIRDSVVIHEGKLASLKRFKDDVKEITKGFECGIQIENYNDIKEGDIIEAFVMEEVKR